ncbi:MAG: hypothetical protein Q8P50_15575 [Bacillota bacterium]|nr:hypothetical protein [Bacillota bacterium]
MAKPVDGRPDLLDRALLRRQEYLVVADPWLRRSRASAEKGRHFESLIYLWVTFNAWLGEVVANRDLTERDSYLVAAAGRDPLLNRAFKQRLADEVDFADSCEQFRGLWPVLKTRALTDLGIPPWSGEEQRRPYVRRAIRAGLRSSDYRPSCATDHSPTESFDPSAIPLDWPHLLDAIYGVRCNLFHGGKSFLNPEDTRFVQLSHQILRAVWCDGDIGQEWHER